MPLQIIRQDITKMRVDAIVNTTNEEMVGYSGVDLAVHEAAGPELGNRLYEKFLEYCAELGYAPQHGIFGADMQVASVNDGPVTLILDTDVLLDTPRRK